MKSSSCEYGFAFSNLVYGSLRVLFGPPFRGDQIKNDVKVVCPAIYSFGFSRSI